MQKTAVTDPPYWKGLTTLAREVVLDDVPVRGRLPEWLSGMLLRTGPAKFEVGAQHYRHWFDGQAMLHRFSFAGGKVSYANRYLQSQSYVDGCQSGRISRAEFATDPCLSLFGRVRSLFSPKLTDNANVNVSRMADAYVALTEVPLPISFDPQTLRTIGPAPLADELDGQVSTAHPHVDFATARSFNYQIRMGRKNDYLITYHDRAHPRGAVLAKLPVDKPAYMHSFGLSERYIVLVEFPLVVNPLRLAFSGLTATPFIRNYRWRPERGTRFWVIDKSDGRVVRRAAAPGFFCFHHVNAFERGGDVIVDLSAYSDPSVIDQLYLDRLHRGTGFTNGVLRRFRLPASGDAIEETIPAVDLELPRLNYRAVNGRDYRYVFGVASSEPGNFIDRLVKLDLSTGETRTWSAAHCYPGEAIFVPSPDGRGEDHGILLSVVLDGAGGRSFLLVLDAQAFEEQARAELPHHIPFSFHGQYFAEQPEGLLSVT